VSVALAVTPFGGSYLSVLSSTLSALRFLLSAASGDLPAPKFLAAIDTRGAAHRMGSALRWSSEQRLRFSRGSELTGSGSPAPTCRTRWKSPSSPGRFGSALPNPANQQDQKRLGTSLVPLAAMLRQAGCPTRRPNMTAICSAPRNERTLCRHQRLDGYCRCGRCQPSVQRCFPTPNRQNVPAHRDQLHLGRTLHAGSDGPWLPKSRGDQADTSPTRLALVARVGAGSRLLHGLSNRGDASQGPCVSRRATRGASTHVVLLAASLPLLASVAYGLRWLRTANVRGSRPDLPV